MYLCNHLKITKSTLKFVILYIINHNILGSSFTTFLNILPVVTKLLAELYGYSINSILKNSAKPRSCTIALLWHRQNKICKISPYSFLNLFLMLCLNSPWNLLWTNKMTLPHIEWLLLLTFVTFVTLLQCHIDSTFCKWVWTSQ